MSRETMQHLKCLCFLRPTKQNIQLIIREIKEPKYGQYYLYFTNTIEKMDLKLIAENDDHEVVRLVSEFFTDYCAINQHVFSFNLEKCYNVSINFLY
jgi:vacuolar protein sorting-associated protein 45